VDENGRRFVRDCICKSGVQIRNSIKQANIPERYKHVGLENFETHFSGCTKEQKFALAYAKRFTGEWLGRDGTGIVFMGNVGSGKTHLAVGVLSELLRQGLTGIFYDQQQLLSLLRRSYEKESKFEESDVLIPAATRDVLVIDDLGSMPMTDWGKERLVTVLNERYNQKRITLVTTNYRFSEARIELDAYQDPAEIDRFRREKLMYTLGDRITDRMLSRLQQMCVLISVSGPNFRSGAGNAAHRDRPL
jgi:DNA replication protein DnaC